MKTFLVRNAAVFAALAMATIASSESRTIRRVVPVAAHANLVRPRAIQPARDSIDDSVSAADAMLMFVSGAGVLALQLRRRQKGLRRTRLTLPTT
jgi:hypothetical protein